MEYRRATADDIPALISIRKQQLIDEGCSPNDLIDDPLDRFFLQMMESGNLAEWVMEEGSGIIATSAVCFYDYPPSYTNPSGKIAYITNMYTHPGFRRQGIGRKMLDLAVKEAAARGVLVIRLGASKLGRPVYERYGFKQDTEWLSLRLKPEN